MELVFVARNVHLIMSVIMESCVALMGVAIAVSKVKTRNMSHLSTQTAPLALKRVSLCKQ